MRLELLEGSQRTVTLVILEFVELLDVVLDVLVFVALVVQLVLGYEQLVLGY